MTAAACFVYKAKNQREVWWPSGRSSVSGARGRGFDPQSELPCCVLDTFYFSKALVIPRKQWLCPDMTEKLLTGTKQKINSLHILLLRTIFAILALCCGV